MRTAEQWAKSLDIDTSDLASILAAYADIEDAGERDRSIRAHVSAWIDPDRPRDIASEDAAEAILDVWADAARERLAEAAR